jgi:hypothetical protein
MVRDEGEATAGHPRGSTSTTRPPIQSEYLPAKWLFVDGPLRHNKHALHSEDTYASPYNTVIQISHPACGRTCDPSSLTYQVTARAETPRLMYLLLSPHNAPKDLANDLATLLVESASSLQPVVLALTIDPGSMLSDAGDPELESRTRYSADAISQLMRHHLSMWEQSGELEESAEKAMSRFKVCCTSAEDTGEPGTGVRHHQCLPSQTTSAGY